MQKEIIIINNIQPLLFVDFSNKIKTETNKNFIKNNKINSSLYMFGIIDKLKIEKFQKKDNFLIEIYINKKKYIFDFYSWFGEKLSLFNMKEKDLKKMLIGHYLDKIKIYVLNLSKEGKIIANLDDENTLFKLSFDVMWDETLIKISNNKINKIIL